MIRPWISEPRGRKACEQGRAKFLASWFVMSLFMASTIAETAVAQQLFIYPAQGQTPEQQNRDRYECHTWATQQTGYDPTRPQSGYAAAPPPQNEPQQGGLLRGAGRGAAVGAIGGAIGGNAGKGAAIGALAGGLIGGMRRRNQQRRQESQWQNYQAQQQAARTSQVSSYNRAMAACLNGRGYQVR